MSAAPRRGTADSATRHRMLDVALQLMAVEGYAAVTSRRIAQEVGVTPPLVHYYFRTMDDLFIELLQKVADENLAREAAALASPTPLQDLWKLASNSVGAAATAEFASLAIHRPRVREALARHAVRFRSQQFEVLRAKAERGELSIEPDDVAGVLMMITALGRILGQEVVLDIDLGHEPATELLVRVVKMIEQPKVT